MVADLHRRMAMDLATRVSHASYAYPALLIVLVTSSTLPVEHPHTWHVFAVWCICFNSLRGYLALRREALYDRHPRLWTACLVTATLAVSSAFGLLLTLSSFWYPIEHWNMVAPVLFALAIGAGSLITMTPNYDLMRANTIFMIAPIVLAEALHNNSHSRAFAVSGGMFMAFLLAQGGAAHRNYVKLLWEQALSRKRAQALELARQAAEAASAAKSQFLANLSHEIRTPMNGILGMARLALDEEPPPMVKESIQTLEQCASGLLQILNDMLDFSKLEAGKLVLDRVPFSVRELLDHTSSLLAPEARLKGIELIVDAPADALWVEGDPIRLRQVMLNLIGNAIKFTAEGAVRVTCQATLDGDNCWNLLLAVNDSGIGIDPSHQGAIFEAFQQADGSVTRRFGGTGLGLAICSRIVKAMGGKIAVESVPDQGSRFSFPVRLPASKTTPDQSIRNLQKALGVTPPSARPLAILSAEDNAVNQRLIERLLVRHGHRVTKASTGREAFERATKGEFDIILMDISMPEMDGMECSRQLRQWEASHHVAPTPILALTANAMKGDRERFTAAGMDGYLAKPFSADQLYRLVEQFSAPSCTDPSYSD